MLGLHMIRVRSCFAVFLACLGILACKPAGFGTDSDVSAVPACTVWPSHFMVTKGNIPVFESTDALEENRNAKYVGKGTPVIRELTILNEDKDARLMRIVVRGGSLAGEQRWWTLGSNLESRTKSKCPANTPRKCNENAVHFCDGSGCRCIDAGAAPDDPIGNAVIETVATLGLGSVKSLGYLMITRLSAVRAVPATAVSVATQFGDESVDLVRYVANEQTLAKAEAFIATRRMQSLTRARKFISGNSNHNKLDLSEAGALNYYTGFGYDDMNKALRAADQAKLVDLRPVIEAASSALNKMTDYAFAGTVYRGVSLSPELSAVYKAGSRITEKAFTSTSRNALQKFSGNTIFQIKSVTGRKIEEISTFAHEAEVLFPPGTVFKVIKKSVETINGKQVTHIFMEQVLGR